MSISSTLNTSGTRTNYSLFSFSSAFGMWLSQLQPALLMFCCNMATSPLYLKPHLSPPAVSVGQLITTFCPQECGHACKNSCGYIDSLGPGRKDGLSKQKQSTLSECARQVRPGANQSAKDKYRVDKNSSPWANAVCRDARSCAPGSPALCQTCTFFQYLTPKVGEQMSITGCI